MFMLVHIVTQGESWTAYATNTFALHILLPTAPFASLSLYGTKLLPRQRGGAPCQHGMLIRIA